MNDQNPLYDLINMIQNKDALDEDFSDVLGYLHHKLEDRYINNLHYAVDTQKEQLKNAPPRDIVLLRAMKAYVNQAGKSKLDNTINTLMALNTAQSMTKNLNELSSSSQENTLSAMENSPMVSHESSQATMALLMLTLFGKL